MVKTVEYKDPSRLALIAYLRKKGRDLNTPLWTRLAEDLSKTGKNRAEINVGKLDLLTKPDYTVVIAGKTLADGNINHPITLASYKVSKTAEDKITNAKGKIITIRDLVESNPKAKNVRILR
jgi:large subunit ribosomal protein L18e